MKKFLILTVVLLISTVAFSLDTAFATLDTVSAESIQITEAERIIDKYTGKAVEAFSSAMEQAKPMAQEGFKVLVRLQIAKGIGHLIPVFLVVLCWSLFHKEYNRINDLIRDNYHSGPFSEEYLTPWLLITLITGIISTILSFITVYSGLLYLMAPEWFAIKEILDLF